MTFGKKKKEYKPQPTEAKHDNRKELFCKLDDELYTIDDVKAMPSADVRTLVARVDNAISACEGRLRDLEAIPSQCRDSALLNRTRFARRMLGSSKAWMEAILRQRQDDARTGIEHHFMQAAKRLLTENQYNKILVRAQAEYELEKA